jgi:hypothetical protein
MSLREPGRPKKQCQIHNSSNATTSSTIVGSWIFLVYCVCHVAGQFFPFQCIQSMLSNMMGHPLFSLIDQSLSVLFIRSPNILRAKQADDHLCKPRDTLMSCIFANAEVLINVVDGNATCSHLHGCDIFW